MALQARCIAQSERIVFHVGLVLIAPQRHVGGDRLQVSVHSFPNACSYRIEAVHPWPAIGGAQQHNLARRRAIGPEATCYTSSCAALPVPSLVAFVEPPSPRICPPSFVILAWPPRRAAALPGERQ